MKNKNHNNQTNKIPRKPQNKTNKKNPNTPHPQKNPPKTKKIPNCYASVYFGVSTCVYYLDGKVLKALYKAMKFQLLSKFFPQSGCC